MTSLLVIFTQAPYANATGQEGLDAAISAATMGIETNLLFIDDGLFLLKDQQRAASLGLRQFTKAFKAIADFDIDKSYVDQQGMAARGLIESQLITAVELVDQANIVALIEQHEQVMTF